MNKNISSVINLRTECEANSNCGPCKYNKWCVDSLTYQPDVYTTKELIERVEEVPLYVNR